MFSRIYRYAFFRLGKKMEKGMDGQGEVHLLNWVDLPNDRASKLFDRPFVAAMVVLA
jgi:hypothetical protein